MLWDLITGSGGYSAPQIAVQIFALLVILFVAFPVHECSHGLMAKLLGDPTAEQSGRLTLNPFSHIDPMGALSMALFGIGWAKPVPINPGKCSKCKPKTAMALTAAAGPLSNLILSYIFMIVFKIVLGLAAKDVVLNGDSQLAVNPSSIYPYILSGIYTVVRINVFLAVFNMLPIPPFDGSRLFLAFLPTKYYFKIMKYERVIMVAVMLLLLTGILSFPLNFVTGKITDLLDMGTDFVAVLMGY